MPSNNLIFHNGTVILPSREVSGGAVVCRNGRITAVGRANEIKPPPGATHIDARGGFIGPGYIDIHVHGGDGADFMDGTVEAVRTVTRAHARHGTTSIFPTTTTGSRAQIDAMLSSCKTVQRKPNGGARIAGVHLYGPYFAEDKVGCHLKGGRRDPDPDEYIKQFKLDIIRIATCAAELPGAEKF